MSERDHAGPPPLPEPPVVGQRPALATGQPPSRAIPGPPPRPTSPPGPRMTGRHPTHGTATGGRMVPSAPSAGAAVPPPLLQPGDILTGTWRWRLTRRLGSGGYGSVWHARREDDGAIDAPADEAAVKLVHPPDGVDADVMLRRELAAMLAMRSERIPRALDWAVGRPDGFVAMRYHAGGSLYDAILRGGALGPEAAWRLLLDLLEALRVAHHAAVLHLDVKPGNVLRDSDGGWVLTDFGIAQGAYVSSVVGAVGVGTRGFQAPEQRALEIDAFDLRTDLWGVGATLWSALTGIDPSRRPDVVLSAADPVTRAGMVRPSKLAAVPPPLEEAVLQLLAFDPVDRPGSAAEALVVARRLLSGHRQASSTAIELRGRMPAEEAADVLGNLFDPLWRAIASQPGAGDFLVRYSDGEVLCREGERSYHAWALLRGVVRIERGGKLLATIDREGTFLGEVAALTGASRTAAMRAQGTVVAMLFNAAELEQFIVANPALALRLVHSIAAALERESRVKR